MADVTEVIHKISYEVNDEALINATKAIQAQVAELNKLGVALNGYTQQLAKLSSAQTQQFDALLSKISSTNNKITELSSKAQGAITEILKGVVDGFGKDPDLQSNVKKYVTAVKKQYKELTNEVEAYKKTSIGFGKDVGDGLAKGAKSSELNLGKLAKSLASTTGLLDIGISLLVNFGVELIKDGGILDSFANKQKNVVTETDKIISKFAVLTTRVAESATQELTSSKLLYKTATDVNQSYALRLQAVDELQKKYPAYFGNLSKEAILAGKAADKYKELSSAIIAKATVQVYEEELQELIKQQLVIEKNIEFNRKAQVALQTNPNVGKGDYSSAIAANNAKTSEKFQKLIAQYEAEKTANITEQDRLTTRILDTQSKYEGLFKKNQTTTTTDTKLPVVAPPKKPIKITADFSADESQMQDDLNTYLEEVIRKIKGKLTLDLSDIDMQELGLLKEIEDLYAEGYYSHEMYEKEKTEVTRKYTLKRLQTEADALADMAKNYQKGSVEYEDIQRQRQKKLLEVVRIENATKYELEQQQLKLAEDNRKKEEEHGKQKLEADELAKEKRKKTIQEFQNLASAAVQAYSTISKAQQEALDKEIAYREKRVETAKKLAERGNADLLKMEEKRLEEAQKKKEEIARRDATVNAALAATNALVAVTGALATAAKNGDGYSVAARVAIALSAILAALGTGYAFVKSLDTSAAFADGVVGYKGQGGPRDDQNIVRISNGESVITAEGTQRNRALLEAINRGESFTMMGSGLPFVMPNFKSPTGASGYASASNMRKVEQKLDRVVMAIEDNRMKQNIFFNEHGVGLMTERAIKKNNRRFK